MLSAYSQTENKYALAFCKACIHIPGRNVYLHTNVYTMKKCVLTYQCVHNEEMCTYIPMCTQWRNVYWRNAYSHKISTLTRWRKVYSRPASCRCNTWCPYRYISSCYNPLPWWISSCSDDMFSPLLLSFFPH